MNNDTFDRLIYDFEIFDFSHCYKHWIKNHILRSIWVSEVSLQVRQVDNGFKEVYFNFILNDVMWCDMYSSVFYKWTRFCLCDQQRFKRLSRHLMTFLIIFITYRSTKLRFISVLPHFACKVHSPVMLLLWCGINNFYDSSWKVSNEKLPFPLCSEEKRRRN